MRLFCLLEVIGSAVSSALMIALIYWGLSTLYSILTH